MEDLEQQTKVINLGKLMVKELGLDNSCDTLARWMAHYLAEKITASERLSGEEKKEASKNCFDTILKLWEHRWHLRSGSRPLEDFEPILRTLYKLNPDEEEPFFIELADNHQSSKYDGTNEPKDLRADINTAILIDKAARILIEDILQQVAMKAKNENTEAILNIAESLSDSNDAKVIRIIFEDISDSELSVYNKGDFEKKYKFEKLQRRIKELEKFTELSNHLLESYRTDLLEIESHLQT